MSSKYQRLVARGRIAAIPVVAAAAITGGVVGVTSASAKKVGSTAGAAVSKSTLSTLKKLRRRPAGRSGVDRSWPRGQRQEGAQGQDDRDVPDQL